jgi:Fe-S-cluster containining protein
MPPAPIEGLPDPDGADCLACGRCCHHGPRTVHLLDTDEARMLAHPDGEEMLRRLTVLDDSPPGWRFVDNTGERCAALVATPDGGFPCAMYPVRPDDCRLVEPGSPACLQARALGRLGSSVAFARLR